MAEVVDRISFDILSKDFDENGITVLVVNNSLEGKRLLNFLLRNGKGLVTFKTCQGAVSSMINSDQTSLTKWRVDFSFFDLKKLADIHIIRELLEEGVVHSLENNAVKVI